MPKTAELANSKLGDIARGWEIGKHPRHKYIWVTCPQCTTERWSLWGHAKLRVSVLCQSCNMSRNRKAMRGERNGRWTGGRIETPSGYIDICIQPDSPYYQMANTSHHVREHRLIMAKHLGRCLDRWEIVHHINGIKGDNGIENLELIGTQREHLPSIYMQKEIIKLQKEILKWQKLTVWLIQEKTEQKQLK